MRMQKKVTFGKGRELRLQLSDNEGIVPLTLSPRERLVLRRNMYLGHYIEDEHRPLSEHFMMGDDEREALARWSRRIGLSDWDTLRGLVATFLVPNEPR